MIGTCVMLVGGYAGEVGYIGAWAGFIIGMVGWAYILYEIFAGEASRVAAEKAPPSVQSAFSTMRWIVYHWLGDLPNRLFHGLPQRCRQR